MQGGSSVQIIPRCQSIRQRDPAVASRATHGHREGDFAIFVKPRQSDLVLHDRQSRVILVTATPERMAERAASALVA